MLAPVIPAALGGIDTGDDGGVGELHESGDYMTLFERTVVGTDYIVTTSLGRGGSRKWIDLDGVGLEVGGENRVEGVEFGERNTTDVGGDTVQEYNVTSNETVHVVVDLNNLGVVSEDVGGGVYTRVVGLDWVNTQGLGTD